VVPFLAFSIGRAWSGFWRNAGMSIAATATMVLLLLLLSGFWIIQSGLLAGLEFVEQKVEVVADLEDAATKAQVDQLTARVTAMPEVRSVAYVSRDEALQRFRDARAAQGEEDFTRFLEANPLHASLEISLRSPADYTVVSTALEGDPAVLQVKNIADLVDRVVSVTGFMRTAGVVVLVVIALIVLFIIVNTIRLAVVSRAPEIEIMRLVGASDAFIRWPFIFEGALVGLFGALIAAGVLAAVSDPLAGFMYDFFRILPIQVGLIARDVAILVFGAGIGLGVLGSFISVRAYLRR
jgi:cell division transport system permease protein